MSKILQERLDIIASRRTELNKRESALMTLFNLRNDMMSKWLSKQIDWDIFENIMNDIRKELEEQSKIINPNKCNKKVVK